MASDSDLRTALVWLAAAVSAVGVYSLSWKKAAVTYVVGMMGIAGVLLPDWEYFDRDFSMWFDPLTVDRINPADAHTRSQSRGGGSTRFSFSFSFYPIRTVVYVATYGFGIYKWWNYVIH